MQELTVISGKGGTGKTSVTASLAALADDALLVDCDVETPDLHLVLSPEVIETTEFVGGKLAHLRWDLCLGCGRCEQLCRFDAIQTCGPPNRFADRTYVIDSMACEGCGLCAAICPAEAIQMGPAVDGQWYVSRTRFGTLVHARLKPGHGNSGKLVSLLRKEGRRLAGQEQHRLIICDGVPGIAYSTIASLSGADLALVVAEPSVSGLHDFQRVVELAQHFSVPALVCVNKFDVNLEMTARIERYAGEVGVAIAGRIPSDDAVNAAQMQGLSVVEHSDGRAAAAIQAVWQDVQARLEQATIAVGDGLARNHATQEHKQ